MLMVEVLCVPGDGRLSVTGRAGDVLKESARLVHSYCRRQPERFGRTADQVQNTDFHVHLAGGASPREGTAAGLPIMLGFASALSQRPLPADTAAVGEVTLHGKVLAVDGIAGRLAAARRAGIRKVLLPARNEPDVRRHADRIPSEEVEIVYVATVKEALDATLPELPQPDAVPS
jgi:ATP-dependent Lon protease